jgi:thiamine monophosphate synthase
VVQLRNKSLPREQRRFWAEVLREQTSAQGQLLVVNGDGELANAVHADGVHLPEASPPTALVRAQCRPGSWVTRAWHRTTLPAEERPDAWVLSPVCAPRKGRPALGLAGLAEGVQSADRLGIGPAERPHVIALGGVDATQARACVAVGAAGVAVLGAARSVESALEVLDALGLLASD